MEKEVGERLSGDSEYLTPLLTSTFLALCHLITTSTSFAQSALIPFYSAVYYICNQRSLKY